MPNPNPLLILGSTSRYRRELLERLRLDFSVAAPLVDETALPGEAPDALARRLGLAKARAVASTHPNAYVIGSDQVAHCRGRALGKPGHFDAALDQLRWMRGQITRFDTALSIVGPQFERSALVTIEVELYDETVLSDEALARYLHAEEPYDCAGSAKSEGLGISLMKRLSGDDPTALVGLPLIALTAMLRDAGFRIPA